MLSEIYLRGLTVEKLFDFVICYSFLKVSGIIWYEVRVCSL